MKYLNPEIYNFGDFRLDVATGVLLRDGEPVTLQWKAFETLCVLVRSEGRLISRSELIEAIWPDSFVEENNLSQQIRTLRKALGDGENGVRFIETVPRRGFRFLPAVQRVEETDKLERVGDTNLAVTEVQEDVDITVANASLAVPIRERRKRWPIIAAAVAILAAGIGGLTYWLTRPTPTELRIQYANQIRLAGQALEASNLTLLKKQLDLTTPKKGEEDLRGFEWGYLAHQLAERTASQPITLKNESRVNSVAFSADSKTLATGSDDARLWDVSTGQQTALFKGHTKPVVSVTISPDGTKLATGSDDKTAKLWDISTSQMLWSTIPSSGEGWNIGRLAFSRDGNTLSGEDDHKIKVWDIATGTETNPYVKFGDIGHPFVVSPDGKFLAAQGPIFIMSVFDIASGRRIASIDSKVGFVTDVKFAPDSKSILIAGTWDSNNTAKLWSLPEGKEIMPFSDITEAIAFSPNGKLIATANKNNTIKLWDAEKGYEIASLPGHADRVVAVDFSPDGLKLASGSLDNTTKIWNVPKNESRGIVRAHAKGISSLIFSPDGKTIVSASNDRTAKLWDVETEQERVTFSGHTDSVFVAAFAPDGLTLATAGNDLTIKLWDVVTGRQRLSIESLKPTTVLTFSPDGKLLASGHWWHDLGARLWDTASGTLSCSADTRGNGDWSVEFSKDAKQFITATPPGDNEPSEDNAIRFWEAASCREISRPIHGEPGTAFGVAYVGGELRALQILNNRGSGKLLDIESRKELASFFGGHESDTRGHAFSPDGKRLFTSDVDGRIKSWDVATGQELLSLKVNAGEAGSLAFSPNGNVLAAAGDGGIIRLFRANPLN
jgi:WD40 repeat protein/DNA-binding winged helix-turn-helix (wHTH) protein